MNVDSDIAAIKNLLEQYAANVNAGDFDSWLSLWADDGTAMPPGASVCVGKEQIREAMEPEFNDMSLEMEIQSIEDAQVFGNLGLTRCKYTLRATPKAGGESIDAMPDGKALTLYMKQSNGSWKIIYDCYNASVPA